MRYQAVGYEGHGVIEEAEQITDLIFMLSDMCEDDEEIDDFVCYIEDTKTGVTICDFR